MLVLPELHQVIGRMLVSDPASFRRDDIEAVYVTPRCCFTLSRMPDGHHILGRGYDFGFGTSKPGRKAFSSILNFVPLSREIHHGPLRDSRECRRLFLRLAQEKVDEAVRVGSYRLSKIDAEFMTIAAKWIEENPVD